MVPETPEYLKGAQFINEDTDISDEVWTRDPGRCRPSRIFSQRLRELGGIISGDDIEQAIKYGVKYAAARGCVAYVTDLGGVALYIIVTSDIREETDTETRPDKDVYPELDVDDMEFIIVSLWPYVYDREDAWMTGRWTGQDLDKIEEIKPEDWHQS